MTFPQLIPKMLIDGGYVTLLGGAVPVVIGNITIVIGIGAPIFQSMALRIHNYHGLNPNFTAKYGKTG
jgi:hypothetical protein